MTTEKNKPSKRARQVTIPAGKLFITFNPGDTVYVQDASGLWPDAFKKLIDKREEAAYFRGATDEKRMQEQMAKNGRPQTPEEFLQSLLPTLHNFHVKDQNQIAAVILDELNKARVKRLNELEIQLNNTRELIALCEDSQKGLQLVREGGFEKLNFR